MVLGADRGGCLPRSDGQGCALGSVRSMTGHPETPCPTAPLGLQRPEVFFCELSRPLLHIALSSPSP